MDTAIISSNKLIAEFMGGKYDKDTSFPIHPNDIWLPHHGIVNATTIELGRGPILHYHNSWDWLMPVVEKIETTPCELPEKYRRGFLKNYTHADVTINTIYDSREQFKGWSSRTGFEGGSEIFASTSTGEDIVRYQTKIEAIYIAVVAFINWYNNYHK